MSVAGGEITKQKQKGFEAFEMEIPCHTCITYNIQETFKLI